MKIEGDYAIVETAEEAAAVFGLGCMIGARIVPAKVLAAITPKEGDAVFHLGFNDSACPTYDNCWDCSTADPHFVIKANALTIGKTVGELRELLRWANDER